MPKSSQSTSGGSRKRGKAKPRRDVGWGKVLLGVLCGVGVAFGAIPAYFLLGNPPVAVTDRPALWEHLMQHTAVERRMHREAKPAPFLASEDVFEEAARTYRTQCAQCHGTPAQDAAIATSMVPRAPQFFTRDRKATAAQPAGELFWATAFGIRRSGMPAYRRSLSNTQLWQLAVLLHSADQPLPDPVRNLLAPAIPATVPTNATAAETRTFALPQVHGTHGAR